MKLHHYWRQVHDLTLASVKSRYRKTWAGFIWVIFNPIILFGAQSLVFRKFLKLDIPDYYLFLLGGLLPWIFISSTILMGTPVFVSQAHLLRSFKINPMVILCAQVLDNFVNFLVSFILVLLPFYLINERPIYMLTFLPLALFPLLVGTFAITTMLCVLNVFYRDINFVMGFILNLLFYLTPIFYPKDFIPDEWLWMVVANPLVYLIEPFRNLIHQNSLPSFLWSLLPSFGISIVLALGAILVWKRKFNDFYRRL